MTTAKFRSHTGRFLLAATISLLVAGVLPFGWISENGAQAAGESVVKGRVTAKTEAGIEVDRKAYILRAQTTIQDERGASWAWNKLVKGTEVHLTLRDGKVERILVILND